MAAKSQRSLSSSNEERGACMSCDMWVCVCVRGVTKVNEKVCVSLSVCLCVSVGLSVCLCVSVRLMLTVSVR
jgi:hypothetical protein